MQTPVIEFDYGDALNKARAAYQIAIMGGQVTKVRDQNGEQIEYSASSLSKLAAWIAYLEMKTGVACVRGPLGFIY